MFEHLTRAHREIPAVTWVEECDFSHVDLKLLVPLVLKAVAESLREFPELNARVEDGELVLLDRYDIGIAVQTDQGLVVPVVRDCDKRPLDVLDAEVRRLAEAAQAGTLAPEELRGGTFTVTSAGRAGGLLVTPLVNHPEVAILGDPPHRRPARRPRRRGRRPPDGQHLGHVRPPRDRREAGGRLRARRDRAAPEDLSRRGTTLGSMGGWYWIGVSVGLGTAAGVLLAGVLTGAVRRGAVGAARRRGPGGRGRCGDRRTGSTASSRAAGRI